MKRFLAGFLFALTMLLAVVIGLVLAYLYDGNCQVVYESKLVFQISPNWTADDTVSDAAVTRLVEVCDQPHDDLIVSPAMIEDCFTKNDLFVLDAFREVEKEDAVAEAVKNRNRSRAW